MAAVNFEASLAAVLAHEGGYVNHPRDPGGPTNFGITLRTLSGWRGRPVTAADVKALQRSEVGAIYRRQYWTPIRGDELPPGLDLALFDYAVNSGPGRAVRDLQRAIKVTADGVLGLITLQAIKSRDTASLINALCDRRLAFMRSLKTWRTFGKGWRRRVEETREAALAMVVGVKTALFLFDPTPGRADEADVSAWRTPQGKAQAARVTGAVGAAATTVGGLIQPLGEQWQAVGLIAVGLLVVGAIAGVIVAQATGPLAEEAPAFAGSGLGDGEPGRPGAPAPALAGSGLKDGEPGRPGAPMT
jgi:lysozyme family protein